ncbi:MAG: hypothetical protein B7733_17710 [Myxococcales bacterium FL481]|nr:MAG: hypothetical protein B7733_17710 [Myxococcales bacterium FL481]
MRASLSRVARRQFPVSASRRVGLLLLGSTLAGGCVGDANPGIDPPDDALFFPQGLALDPRVSDADSAACTTDLDCTGQARCVAEVCREPARWLFVANANSDLRFNSGTMLAVDLDAFLRKAVEDEHQRPQNPTSNQDFTVPGPDHEVDPSDPAGACRRLAGRPSTVECTEEPFVRSEQTVRTGSFAADLGGWNYDSPGNDALLVGLVRGDPSVTFARIRGGLEGDDLKIDCGQHNTDGRACDDAHKLDEHEGQGLGLEPTSLALADLGGGRGQGYVAHSYVTDVTLIDLGDSATNPTIADRASLTPPTRRTIGAGGYGIDVRPCDPAASPALTPDCSRPLVYAGYRFERVLSYFTSVPMDDGSQDLTRGGVVTAGAPPATAGSRLEMGGMAFSQDGRELFLLQSLPGALIRIEAEVNELGSVINEPAAEVEVCSRPKALALYENAHQRYGLLTCYVNSSLFIVDLDSFSVVATLFVGAGAHKMVVDPAREYVYVANTLEATLSVVDLSRHRPSRFTEVARLGIREPYSS